MKSICLVSGGMDSLVTAAIAAKENNQLAFLHLNYGQKTQDKELQSFHQIADHYKVDQRLRKVIDLSFLSQIGGSSLTDASIEVTDYQGNSAEIPSSYVPFRNSIILSMAVSWAEVLKAKKIYIGAVHEDSSGYPDCRPSYYEAFQKVIQQGAQFNQIKIQTPVINMSKKDIVLKAFELNAPLEYSWSCYKDSKEACGLCDSCALRLKGFQIAGKEDPLPYKIRPDYLT